MAEPVRYYFDQHMDPAVSAGLRRHGIDCLTAQEAGRCGFADSDQLTFATANGRVMVTFDVDYLALHSSGTPHAGIAWTPALKYTLGQLVAMLVLLHAVYSADDMLNRLEHL